MADAEKDDGANEPGSAEEAAADDGAEVSAAGEADSGDAAASGGRTVAVAEDQGEDSSAAAEAPVARDESADGAAADGDAGDASAKAKEVTLETVTACCEDVLATDEKLKGMLLDGTLTSKVVFAAIAAKLSVGTPDVKPFRDDLLKVMIGAAEAAKQKEAAAAEKTTTTTTEKKKESESESSEKESESEGSESEEEDVDESEDVSHPEDAKFEALPSEWTEFYGEVVWAAQPGFAHWPSIIYDPRWTTGEVSRLGMDNLGQQHLCMFFATVARERFGIADMGSIVGWKEGLAQGFDKKAKTFNKGSVYRDSFPKAVKEATEAAAKHKLERGAEHHTKKKKPPATAPKKGPAAASLKRGARLSASQMVVAADTGRLKKMKKMNVPRKVTGLADSDDDLLEEEEDAEAEDGGGDKDDDEDASIDEDEVIKKPKKAKRAPADDEKKPAAKKAKRDPAAAPPKKRPGSADAAAKGAKRRREDEARASTEARKAKELSEARASGIPVWKSLAANKELVALERELSAAAADPARSLDLVVRMGKAPLLEQIAHNLSHDDAVPANKVLETLKKLKKTSVEPSDADVKLAGAAKRLIKEIKDLYSKHKDAAVAARSPARPPPQGPRPPPAKHQPPASKKNDPAAAAASTVKRPRAAAASENNDKNSKAPPREPMAPKPAAPPPPKPRPPPPKPKPKPKPKPSSGPTDLLAAAFGR